MLIIKNKILKVTSRAIVEKGNGKANKKKIFLTVCEMPDLSYEFEDFADGDFLLFFMAYGCSPVT